MAGQTAALANEQESSTLRQRIVRRRVNLIFDLALTPKQQQQLFDLRASNKGKIKDLYAQLLQKRTNLKQEIGKPQIDMKKVNSISAEIKILYSKILDQRIASIIAIKSILTPKQFQMLQDKMKQLASETHFP
jgi:Spy/CpxP family protein refolding chaperone